MEQDNLISDEIQKWLTREISHYAGLHERRGGVPLTYLLKAFDPDKSTDRHQQVERDMPGWLDLPARERSKLVRTTLNSMVSEGRLKTGDDDAIHYLNKMLQQKHTPETSYLPVNVLDQMAEHLRNDDDLS